MFNKFVQVSFIQKQTKVRTLFFLLLFFCIVPAFAQKTTRIELLGANSLEFDASLGNNARRLIGDVKFKHEDVLMYCDSAYLYSETNSLDAFGKIHIIQDNTDIFGNLLKYNGNTRKADIINNVRMIDKDVTLTTDLLIYDLKNNQAHYPGGGTVVNNANNSTLTSRQGYYYSKSKDFFFKDKVVLINPEYTIHSDTLKYHTTTEVAYFFGPTTIKSEKNLIYCENGWYDTKNEVSQFKKNAYVLTDEQKLYGDSLYYNKATGIGKVFYNVVIIDTVQKFIINSDFATFYEKTNKSVITGNPVLTMIMETDSLFLKADTLFSEFDDSTNTYRVLHAYHNSKFYKSDMQGICDSLVYNFRDSIINLYHNPILWSKENQMLADFITIKTADGKIQAMELQNEAFIISQEDTLFFNQIKGKNITATFSNNELYRIDAKGNGETIYFTREDNGDMFGMNKAQSSELLIYLKENNIEKISFLKNPEAILYPIEDAPKDELTLKNFKWKADIRPASREEITQRKK
jgi:lipopolysaccharide export system protein LptA